MESGAVLSDDPARPAGPVTEWVVFHCGGHAFGLPIQRIREIVPPQPFTRLPGSDAAVCGLIGLRGRVITVLDFGAAVGVRPAAQQPEHWILLVEHGDRLVGLAVEAVAGVARTTGELAVSGETLAALDAGRDEILGVAAADGRPFVVTEIDRLIARLLPD